MKPQAEKGAQSWFFVDKAYMKNIAFPKNPGSPYLRMVMEPKYYAFRFGDWTPQSLFDNMSGRVSLSSPEFWWDKMAGSATDPYNPVNWRG